jgi:hypothetical protein
MPMPQPLSEREEQKLLSVADEALRFVQRGDSPNQALAKVAAEKQLNPGEIRLLCAAYNNGRQLAQRQHQSTILDKLASFTLADADQVIRSVYRKPSPTTTKQASWQDYAAPPSLRAPALLPGALTKQASALRQRLPRRRPDTLEQLTRQKEAADKAASIAGQAAQEAYQQLHRAVSQWVDYFRVQPQLRLPFAAVKQAALDRFGSAVEPLLALVPVRVPALRKQASDRSPITTQPLDATAPPLSYLADCLRYAQQLHQFRSKQAQAQSYTSQKQQQRYRLVQRQGRPTPQELFGVGALEFPVKQAAGAPLLAASIAAGPFGRLMGNVTKSKGELVQEFKEEMTDPKLQKEMMQAQAHAFLHQVLTDPDDPISGYDPDKVLNAYNEIVGASPHLTGKPLILKPLIRKKLVGNYEPFEAKEVTEMGRNIAMANNQSRSDPTSLEGGSRRG